MFRAWGTTEVAEARRLVDICIEAGVNLFDTADNYSNGRSEQILGEAIAQRRGEVLIATKTTLPLGEGPEDGGSSRARINRAVDDSLRRLGVGHIDLLQLHAFDALTPIEETLTGLDDVVRAGKVRHVGASNFSGWQLMKSLAVADKLGAPRYCAHQVYYSLLGRDYEWELMPLALDQGIGGMVWSPLGWGRLTGKLKRGVAPPPGSRLHDTESDAPPVEADRLYRIAEGLDAIAAETGRSVPQIAINWLLQRPSVSTVVIGARNEAQLRENLVLVAGR